jgi:hypothetical protein
MEKITNKITNPITSKFKFMGFLYWLLVGPEVGGAGSWALTCWPLTKTVPDFPAGSNMINTLAVFFAFGHGHPSALETVMSIFSVRFMADCGVS